MADYKAERASPLSPTEVQAFLDMVKIQENYGEVNVKSEGGKFTRITVTYNYLPHEVRKMIRV